MFVGKPFWFKEDGVGFLQNTRLVRVLEEKTHILRLGKRIIGHVSIFWKIKKDVWSESEREGYREKWTKLRLCLHAE